MNGILIVLVLVFAVLHNLIVVLWGRSRLATSLLLGCALMMALRTVLMVSLERPTRFLDLGHAMIVGPRLLVCKTVDRGIAFESVSMAASGKPKAASLFGPVQPSKQAKLSFESLAGSEREADWSASRFFSEAAAPMYL